MIFSSIITALTTSLVVCAVFFAYWRRRVQREIEIRAIAAKLSREVDDLIAELNGTTERNVAVLEDSIRKAGVLVSKVEQSATELRREVQKNDLSREVSRNIESPNSSETVVDWKPAATEPPVRDSRDSSTGETVAPGYTDRGEYSPDPDSLSGGMPPVDLSSLTIKDRVLMQYRRGDNIEVISSSLGLSRGEIELIISLHDRRR